MENLQKVEKDRTVVIHNYLINGKFDLSTLEIRTFLYMASEIRPRSTNSEGDVVFHEVHVPVSCITDSVGGKTYNILRKFNEQLGGKTFRVQEIVEAGKNKGKRKTTTIPIFEKLTYIEGSGYIEGKFNGAMAPYLLNLLGNFTKTELKFLLGLKNTNSLRIYLLLKEQLDFGERTIDYLELKEMLSLSDSYPEWYEFKRNVLEQAKKDLKGSDMRFEYEGLKVGRFVKDIRFELQASKKELQEAKRGKKELPASTPAPATPDLFNQPEPVPYTNIELNAWNVMRKYELEEEQAHFFLSKLKGEEITKAIHGAYGKLTKEEKAKVNNPAAQIYEALKKVVERKNK